MGAPSSVNPERKDMAISIQKLLIIVAFVAELSLCWKADRLIHPHYNNLLATIPKWGPSFYVKFDLKVSSFKSKAGHPYSAVLHFTSTNNVCCGFGSRVPGVFLTEDGNKAIFAMSVDGNRLIHILSPGLHEHRWYHFEIRQEKGDFQLFCDGSRFYQYHNPKPVAFYQVRVGSTFPDYRSNGDPPAHATIRNLEYNNIH